MLTALFQISDGAVQLRQSEVSGLNRRIALQRLFAPGRRIRSLPQGRRNWQHQKRKHLPTASGA